MAPDKKNILLIDDEPDITLLVSSLLEFHNFSVTSLNDPTLAMETLEKSRFDLVCTDIMMPNIDGIQLIKEIRKKFPPAQLKLMALSAKEFTEQEYHFFLNQNVLLIKKPYEPITLVNKINDLFKT